MQAIKTMKEAIEHEGPSLIICYAPCNEHGIKGGMSCSYTQEKLAVECGYTLLMRYNPIKKKLYMDSKTPDFNKYDEYLESELRYSNLKKKNEKEAQDLLKLNKKNSVNRYNYYINLSNSN
jgi:pyruvate-ferredoxin/flavodoxin oxidoreductase